jgi:sulfur carrier protein
MILNGRPLELEKTRTLMEVLTLAGLEKVPVAVLHNGQIVPKVNFPSAVIKNDDVLEVVSFVGGG